MRKRTLIICLILVCICIIISGCTGKKEIDKVEPQPVGTYELEHEHLEQTEAPKEENNIENDNLEERDFSEDMKNDTSDTDNLVREDTLSNTESEDGFQTSEPSTQFSPNGIFGENESERDN